LWWVLILVPGILVAAIVGALADSELVSYYVGFVVGLASSFAVGIYVLRGVLRKDFEQFRICLIPQAAPVASNPSSTA
jgi:hypothetical protein